MGYRRLNTLLDIAKAGYWVRIKRRCGHEAQIQPDDRAGGPGKPWRQRASAPAIGSDEVRAVRRKRVHCRALPGPGDLERRIQMIHQTVIENGHYDLKWLRLQLVHGNRILEDQA